MVLRASEAIRLMIRRTGNNIASVGREIGYKSPANIVNMLNRDSMKLNMAAIIAEICGYKIVLVPEDTEIENGIEIEPGIEE